MNREFDPLFTFELLAVILGSDAITLDRAERDIRRQFAFFLNQDVTFIGKLIHISLNGVLFIA